MMPNADQTLAVALAVLVALASILVAVLAGGGLTRETGAPQAAGPSATCQEWTDGCVVCARAPAGLSCSTPGIACMRGAPRCLRE
jgi:hypothetical protein